MIQWAVLLKSSRALILKEEAQRLSEEGDAVGDVDRDGKSGFHIGEAPIHARPTTGEIDKQQDRNSLPIAPSPMSLSTARTHTSAKFEVGLDKNAAYLTYTTRTVEGVEKNNVLKERQAEAKTLRASIKVNC